MKSILPLILAVLLTSLLGCVSSAAPRVHGLPYDAWSLGFVAPNYMEVWIEAAEVEDVSGNLFANLETGTASIGYREDAAGWGDHVGFGKSRQVTGAALPKRVYVRWQSVVEPQTYDVFLDIPESARKAMLTKARHRVLSEEFYREALVVGLAPGGWVKVWVSGAAGEAIEVLCTQAKIEPKGPYNGMSGGRYRPLSERAVPYVRTHDVPYKSWRCDGWGSEG